VSSAAIVRQWYHVSAVARIHDGSSNARRFSARRGTVAIIVLFSTLRLASATAQAHQVPHTSLKLNASTSASGWWSLQKAQAPIAPHLQLSMIEQANIETSGLSRTFRIQSTNARQTDACENKITLVVGNHATKARVGCTLLSHFHEHQRSDVNIRGYDPRVDAQPVEVSPYPLGPRSGFFGDLRSSALGLFLYSGHIRSGLWEQHIADTRFLTDEERVPAYPFMEDLASSHFSISLYIPPLRGSLRTSR
jgi:hypothetical protein